jgi:hypothetical protein
MRFYHLLPFILILIPGQAIGFSAGYFLESFRVTVYAVFIGVGFASIICVPDWGVFRGKHARTHAPYPPPFTSTILTDR